MSRRQRRRLQRAREPLLIDCLNYLARKSAYFFNRILAEPLNQFHNRASHHHGIGVTGDFTRLRWI